ncbi:MAG TPA: adenosylcobinamide-GDP ribazoletransferase [Intrasporangium sp.]|uniref:adenosylcobinamide-GDP ribazoletransferase n=1 Tax=Intrasporangium sp. TaxID=1925024 RepID=UPI002D7897EC|nr:adenosylcobinamide-GDP ribazoletransferase [Intrasporangium sp.]HET7399644.1 adenosylcobinamide-GDP ribazoletransferase [Intrasporangium sp.]
MTARPSDRDTPGGNGLRLAFGLLTAVRVGRLPAVDRRSAGAAMLLAPITAGPLLGLLWVGHAAVRAGTSALLLSGLVVTAGVLYTRGMHLDGLADTADGLSAGYDAATSLRAMKASDVGPSGVASVVLALLLQVSALSVLLPTGPGAVLAGVALLASRSTLAWSCRQGVPAAQPHGLGALVAGSVGRVSCGLAILVLLLGSAAVAAAAAAVLGAAAGWASLGAVLTGAAGLLAALALRRRCVRRLGGITGDVLGAGVEVGLTAALVVAALLQR